MDKLKAFFINFGNDTRKFFIKTYENTIAWFISVYYWIIKMPRTVQKTTIRQYNNVINLPKNVSHKLQKSKELSKADVLKKGKNFFIRYAIIIALIIMIIVFNIINNNFLTMRNFSTILKNSSYRLLFALGVGTIIIAKGTDLSVGRVVGFTSIIIAVFSQSAAAALMPGLAGTNPFAIIIIAMLVGMSFGFINGWVVTKFRVDPFIATLGMMLMAYGGSYLLLSNWLGGAANVGIFTQATNDITEKIIIRIGDFKVGASVIISFVVALFMWVLWNKTPLGKKIYAIGGNASAAAVSGINVKRIFLITFMIGGALYGLGATFFTWSTGTVKADSATMYELDAIAACIVGGLSFDGGRGKVSGIVIGVLIFECISTGFTLIGLSSGMTYLIKGLIIVAAVTFDMLKVRQKK